MKHLVAVSLALLLVPAALAGGSLKDARKQWLRGNYAEARDIYADLVKAGKDGPAVIIGLSKSHQSEGEYDKAMRVVDAALKQQPKSPELLARRAELLYLFGRWNEAEKTAAAAIDAKDGNFLARWVQAQVLRSRGETAKADEAYRWFIQAFQNEIEDLDDLTIVGLAVLEHARLRHSNQLYGDVLNNVFNEAIKTDKDYWPALYEKGKLFLEKHNKQDAFKAFEKVMEINPQAAEVIVAKGEMAYQGFEMRDAEEFAEEALEDQPVAHRGATAAGRRVRVLRRDGQGAQGHRQGTRHQPARGGDARPPRQRVARAAQAR